MMAIRYILIVLISLHVNVLAKDIDKIRISPLPMANPVKTTKIFSPFIRHVSTLLSKEVSMVYYEEYEDIINSLNKNFLDLAYLGPLPFANIRLKNPNIIPVVGFYETTGLKGYTCVIVRALFDRVDFNNLTNKTIALTQPLSTCGYFMSSQVLKKLNSSLSIKDMKYRYVGTHTGVAKSVIRGEFLLGGLKDRIALKYQNLGLEIVKSSELLPSFILVANENTLNKNLIAKLQKGLLQTPKKIYSSWGEKISHGMFEVSKQDFEWLINLLKTMDIPEKGNY